jgi:hypothetical protein
MKKSLICFGIIFCSLLNVNAHAQLGSIISPTQITYGFETAWQPKYASGFGFASVASISLCDFLASDNSRTGFRIRDVNGGHFALGLRTHPEFPVTSFDTVEVKGGFWYDVGFDFLGIQMLYGFNENLWLSFKGQMVFVINNTAYYEYPIPTNFNTLVLTGGIQAGPMGFEIGKGWEAKHGPNYFTLGASLRVKQESIASKFIGIRFTSHSKALPARYVDGEFVDSAQKNYFFSVFYAKSI